MVHLVVEDDWEIRYPFLNSVFGQSPARFYKCFEVEVNQPLWHLDLQFTLQEGVTHWRRFIFSTVEHVAATLEAHHGKCRLHVQSARVENSDSYNLCPVHFLKVAEDRTGRAFHIVMYEDGQLIYPRCGVQPEELLRFRLIYGLESA